MEDFKLLTNHAGMSEIRNLIFKKVICLWWRAKLNPNKKIRKKKKKKKKQEYLRN